MTLGLNLGLGLGSGGGAGPGEALSYGGVQNLDAVGNSETEPVTFSGFTAVPPHPNRYALGVASGLFNFTSGIGNPTCTINGVSASRFAWAQSGVYATGFRNFTVAWLAKVPTGATLEFVMGNFTVSGSATGDVGLSVYSFSDLGGAVSVIDEMSIANATNGAISDTLTPTAAGQNCAICSFSLNATPSLVNDAAVPPMTQRSSGDIRTSDVCVGRSLVTTSTSALTISGTAATLAGVIVG